MLKCVSATLRFSTMWKRPAVYCPTRGFISRSATEPRQRLEWRGRGGAAAAALIRIPLRNNSASQVRRRSSR